MLRFSAVKVFFRLSAFFLTLLLAVPAQATPHITDFKLGMPRAELEPRGVTPHNKAFPDVLCGEVGFGGMNWKGCFHIHQDLLGAMILSAPLSDEALKAAVQGFKESPYIMFTVLASDAKFDFVERAAQGEKAEQTEAAFTLFLQDLQNRPRDFVAYFYTESAAYERAVEARKKEEKAVGDDVTSCLTVGKDGISILITSWDEMHDELQKSWEEARAPKKPAGR